MKKLAFIAIAAVAFASCSDDDSNDNNAAALAGEWKLTAATMGEAYDINNDGVASTNLMTQTSCFNNSALVLTATGQAVVALEDMNVGFSTGPSTNFTIDCVSPDVLTGTFSINDNRVIISNGVDGYEFTRNGNTMTLHFDGYYGVPGQSGSPIYFTDADFVFTKQ